MKHNNKAVSIIADTYELESSVKDKLPSFGAAECLFTKKAFEQCTSESVARLKSKLFEGNKLLVLAGGLGVDEWAFSSSFKSIISIEPDIELNNISLFNFNCLNVKNINRICDTAEAFIDKNTETFDTIYIDPDRRSNHQRQILLKDHQPNCIELLPELLKISNTVIIKCSPLYDYEMAFKELSNIKEIYSISRKGEMKELLIVCSNQAPNECSLHAIDLINSETYEIVEFNLQSPLSSKPITISSSKKYFYEVGSSIVKLRKYETYGLNLNLMSIDSKVPYFLSDTLLTSFIGRTFKLIRSFDFSAKQLKSYLNENKIYSINLKVRGLNYKTEDIKQSLKIKEGGDDYFFIIPNNNTPTCYHCRKVNY